LVFGTIAAESQRLINETYSTVVQGFMPMLARPDVDVLGSQQLYLRECRVRLPGPQAPLPAGGA
jgi:hypothetical protein